MNLKIFILFACAINFVYCGGILRTPKVYNAVITTDDNLTPSRAFPVIQPTIHETGIATYPFGPFNPYRFYNPQLIHYSQPVEGPFREVPQGIYQRGEPFPIHPPTPPQNMKPGNDIILNMEPPNIPPPSNNHQKPEEDQPTIEEPQQPKSDQMPVERPPIPLNEFGLPPSLVPLHSSYPQRPDHPFNLQPYPYNHYPLIYDGLNQYQDHYLPPYGYYPSPGFGIHPSPSLAHPQLEQKPDKQSTVTSVKISDTTNSNQPTPETTNDTKTNSTNDSNDNLDNIKNGVENKNSEVPDVPPPPLPSGAKKTE